MLQLERKKIKRQKKTTYFLKYKIVNFEDDQEDFEDKNFALMNAEEVQDVLKPEELKIKADGKPISCFPLGGLDRGIKGQSRQKPKHLRIGFLSCMWFENI